MSLVRREAVKNNQEMDKPHKKLDLWNAAMDLAVTVYQVTDSFPREERYALTNQVRRAVAVFPVMLPKVLVVKRKRSSSIICTWPKGRLVNWIHTSNLQRGWDILHRIIGKSLLEEWSGSIRC